MIIAQRIQGWFVNIWILTGVSMFVGVGGWRPERFAKYGKDGFLFKIHLFGKGNTDTTLNN